MYNQMSQVCPTCGRCPTCGYGRGGNYYPQTSPIYNFGDYQGINGAQCGGTCPNTNLAGLSSVGNVGGGNTPSAN